MPSKGYGINYQFSLWQRILLEFLGNGFVTFRVQEGEVIYLDLYIDSKFPFLVYRIIIQGMVSFTTMLNIN